MRGRRFFWTLLPLGLSLVLPGGLQAQALYSGLSQTALATADFCPYINTSPWRRRLPDRPAHRRSGEDAKARSYITNAGPNRPFWRTAGDQDFAGCQGVDYWNRCTQIDQGMVVFVASTADPQVTFTCDGRKMNYGCWEHDQMTCPPGRQCGWTYQGRAPRNLRPGFNGDGSGIGDVNWAIVQPNGDVIEAYHCQIHAPIQSGDTLSAAPGSRCNSGAGSRMGAMLLSNLARDKGTNGAINSGPNGLAIGLKYAHVGVANPQPNSAIWMNTSCNGAGFVYPATSDTRHCRDASLGLRTGTHLQLTLTHAQIDAAIAAGTVQAAWRGILYAAHDYGIYLGDTGCGLGDDQPAFGCGWLESAMQLVANGAHNPWIDWMHSLDSAITTRTYQPTINANPFLPFVGNVIVVEDCYATGTCSDSPPPETSCGGRPAPRNRRIPGQ
jgi:hypothetical protein